jgi:hypothetical protein
MIPTKEGPRRVKGGLLVDFWKDEGGLKGNCCSVQHVRGRNLASIIDSAWESGFLWTGDLLAGIRTGDCESKEGEVIRNETSSQISS